MCRYASLFRPASAVELAFERHVRRNSVESDGAPQLVAEVAQLREALLVQLDSLASLSGDPCAVGECPKCQRMHLGIDATAREQGVDPPNRLFRVGGGNPEVLERQREVQTEVGLTVCHRPVEDRANVVV